MINFIKEGKYWDTQKALEVFAEITGIKAEDDEVKQAIKLLTDKGLLKVCPFTKSGAFSCGNLKYNPLR